LDKGFSVFHRRDQRADDPLRAGIECPADEPWIILGNAHERRHVAGLRRGEALHHRLIAAETMLLVD